MKKLLFFIYFLCFVFGGSFVAQNEEEWKLSSSKEQLEVFTRKSKHSKIKEIRIKTRINCSINELFTVLNDVSTYDNWVYKAYNSKTLKTINDQEFYYYTASDFPFPFNNRDLIVLSKKWYNEIEQTWYTLSEAQPAYLPEEDGNVRITTFNSIWKIKEENGYVDIDYVASTDPGGFLPAWLINMGITTGPIKTMSALIHLIENQ